jgi:ribonuclease T2
MKKKAFAFSIVAILCSNIGVASECHTAAQQDSHVLAMTWQPGFCATHGSKPECQALADNEYAQQNLTLHGLWPNKRSCGENYGFCSHVKEAKDMCDMPKIEGLEGEVLADLERVMPASRFGSCLERHEWWKHGTCSGLSVGDYFSLARALVDKFNGSNFVTKFVRENIGKRVKRRDILNQLDHEFGAGASNYLTLRCHQSDKFEEVRIELPQNIDVNLPLGTLIHHSPAGAHRGNCASEVLIESGAARE